MAFLKSGSELGRRGTDGWSKGWANREGENKQARPPCALWKIHEGLINQANGVKDLIEVVKRMGVKTPSHLADCHWAIFPATCQAHQELMSTRCPWYYQGVHQAHIKWVVWRCTSPTNTWPLNTVCFNPHCTNASLAASTRVVQSQSPCLGTVRLQASLHPCIQQLILFRAI